MNLGDFKNFIITSKEKRGLDSRHTWCQLVKKELYEINGESCFVTELKSR